FRATRVDVSNGAALISTHFGWPSKGKPFHRSQKRNSGSIIPENDIREFIQKRNEFKEKLL
uniref:Uncharacterized protein n=1 Tax=Romanomermis culicivorax TaxID=13658 RepID=A0A915IFD5_ROMCU